MSNTAGAIFQAETENERRHRIVLSIIVFIILGIFTILERFVLFYKENLGLIFGVAFVDNLSPEWFMITAGIFMGVVLIVAGVFMGFQRLWLPAAVLVILTIDLVVPIIVLLNTVVKESLPLLVIIAVRIACLKWLAQGVMAVYQRQQNALKAAKSQLQTAGRDLSDIDDSDDQADQTSEDLS